ncbi:chromate transporter [Paenibacillus taihuensis]|uniref:Chromate transporter n=1 Tax=Paenibacillus taihuensis TaxID=1156355 RepID=A0A3D9R4E1_9BACL|nr:chromate transporter [Paenibacillus taihuensis]REE68707.1 chromate transporter [Paenibacillus taihuensis]
MTTTNVTDSNNSNNSTPKTYTQLCWAMMKTGILGYGGGPSIIPLIRYEAVTKYRWLPDEEFGEILALANALPGPIATKLSAYLGYRLKGALGAVLAVLAHILPSSIAMLSLLSAVNYLSNSAIVRGMISAVAPVIAVMLGVMAYEFGERAVKGLGRKLGIIMLLISFVLLQLLGVHPAIVIVLFLAYGAMHFKLLTRFQRHKQKESSQK